METNNNENPVIPNNPDTNSDTTPPTNPDTNSDTNSDTTPPTTPDSTDDTVVNWWDDDAPLPPGTETDLDIYIDNS